MKRPPKTKLRWVSPPGESIHELMSQRGITTPVLAQKLNCTTDDVENILDGSSVIGKLTAASLADTFGSTAEFWLARDRNFRDKLRALDEVYCTAENEAWLRQLPYKEMVQLGWIAKSCSRGHAISLCLDYFEVHNPSQWEAKCLTITDRFAYRCSASYDSKYVPLLTWLHEAELQSAELTCADWNPSKFLDTLWSLRALTRVKDPNLFLPDLRRACSEAGVALVVLRAPEGCRASGATRFIAQNRALIVLSLRHLSDDHFWFTFFHEAGHLMLHSGNRIFVEDDGDTSPDCEAEADQFAASTLIPEIYWDELEQIPCTYDAVIRFSRKIGIAPGIVVGRLQHTGRIPYNYLNKLKRRYQWLG